MIEIMFIQADHSRAAGLRRPREEVRRRRGLGGDRARRQSAVLRRNMRFPAESRFVKQIDFLKSRESKGRRSWSFNLKPFLLTNLCFCP